MRPHGDRFGVFAQHVYGTVHDYDFQVTVYDIDASTPVAVSDTGLAQVADGDESFTRTTMRGLPENLLLVEGQPFSDPVLVFTDTNSARAPEDYTATITGFSDPAATVVAAGDGTYAVQPDVAQTFYDERVSKLTVAVTADTETLSVDVPYLVQGAPLNASGRTIPMPVDENQDRVLELDDILATFTDANPQSTAESFSLVVQWGDGALNTSADTDANNYPYVWVTENETTHEFQVRGHHGFPTPGAYQIDVRVLEDEHSRAGATSTVTIGQPPRRSTPTPRRPPPAPIGWWRDSIRPTTRRAPVIFKR